jgi:hypothetical protein
MKRMVSMIFLGIVLFPQSTSGEQWGRWYLTVKREKVKHAYRIGFVD